MGSNIKDVLKIFHDPFYDADVNPKIPDGASPYSLGFKKESVTAFRNREGEDTVHIFLYPAIHGSAAIGNCSLLDGLVIASNNDFYIPREPNYGATNIPQALGDQFIDVGGDVSDWRIVSEGLKIKLMNSDDQNDGWWEAVRIHYNQEPNEYELVAHGGSGLTVSSGSMIPKDVFNDWESYDLINQPSYCTGLLKDLEHFQFDLKPISDSVPFTKMIEQTTVNISNVTATGNLPVFCAFTSAPYNLHMINALTDSHYDTLYIRLHCRPNSGTESYSGSQFHLHVKKNIEAIFEKEANEVLFQTASHQIGSQMAAHHDARVIDRNAASHLISP